MRSPRLRCPLRLLLPCLALAACGGSQRAEGGRESAAPPPSVTVARVVSTPLPDERERVGQVQAVEDVELRARISGFLEERRFEEGSDVEKGQVLFVIEREPYEAKVAQAQADLARTKASLQEAQLELRRGQQLRKQNVSSQADLDAAVARQAEAAAEVLAAEAALRTAQLDLDYTRIVAPISGRVGRATFSVGDLVGPESGTLATIASLDPIHVYWQVPEQVILNFRREGLERERRGEGPQRVTARLRFGDGTFYEHEGVWDFLDNRVDPSTGTQTARAVFPNPDGLLLPGQYGTVIVQVGAPRDTLVIPQAAVQEDQAGRFVLVVRSDDTVELRRVAMGARQDIYWEVRQGLAAGERVIYQGIQKARPGEKVAPMELQPQPFPGSSPAPPAGAAPAAPSGAPPAGASPAPSASPPPGG
jgi:membrane fusion protein, multidrug efflux system